jgi:glycosyltransferase involved in cell wall biosynthesis
MAAAILRLIENEQERQRFAENGRAWVKSRSIKALGEESSEFLTEVLYAQ